MTTGKPLSVEVPLPLVDRVVAVFPDVIVLGQPLAAEDLRMDAHDEHLFVVGSVEDPDLAARRQPLLVAAQVVLAALAGRGDLEALDPHALRVHAAHHVADRPVLARGVERLQHHDDTGRRLRRQPLLVLRQQRNAVVQQPDAVLLPLDPRLERGVEVLRQIYLRARAYAKRLDEFRDPLGHVVGHGVLLRSVLALVWAARSRAARRASPVRQSDRV